MWWKSPIFIGIFAALIIRVALGFSLGPLTCKDGWESPSIGRKGACSWHGGVDRRPWVFWVSVAAGIAAGYGAHRVANPKPRRDEALLPQPRALPEEERSPAPRSIYTSALMASEAGMALVAYCDACRSSRTLSAAELRQLGDVRIDGVSELIQCSKDHPMRPLRLLDAGRSGSGCNDA